MNKMILTTLAAILAISCEQYGQFPAANPSDRIACLSYSHQFGTVWRGEKYNDCMRLAGYDQGAAK